MNNIIKTFKQQHEQDIKKVHVTLLYGAIQYIQDLELRRMYNIKYQLSNLDDVETMNAFMLEVSNILIDERYTI